ncbi:MAG TPA: MFS transporter [Gemmatimonadales bacterium]|nr:MFS transporter [Gemmatimonadales bacterium]
MSSTPGVTGRESGLPRTVKGLSLVSLFNDFASEMVYPLLPAFVTRTLGAGPLALGLLDGASELTSSAVKWISGRMSDREGWSRPLILGGYATAVLVRPLIAIAGAAWQVIGFRIVDRIGKGIRTPPRDALIATITAPTARGRAFGFHRGADHFGAVLGSLAAWWLLQWGAEVRSVIGWSVVPGVVAFLVLMVVLRRAGSREPGAWNLLPESTPRTHLYSPNTQAPAPGSQLLAPSSFWPPMLALAALTFFRLPEALLILRLQDRGVSIVSVPLVWAGLHVVRSASSYPGGRIADRIGAGKTVAAGGFLFALVAAGLGLPVDAAWAVVLFLALGLVAGLSEAGERSIVARLSPVRTGRGFGIYHALIGIAALPAGILFGSLYQGMNGGAALWASAGGMLAAVFFWILVSPVE